MELQCRHWGLPSMESPCSSSQLQDSVLHSKDDYLYVVYNIVSIQWSVQGKQYYPWTFYANSQLFSSPSFVFFFSKSLFLYFNGRPCCCCSSWSCVWCHKHQDTCSVSPRSRWWELWCLAWVIHDPLPKLWCRRPCTLLTNNDDEEAWTKRDGVVKLWIYGTLSKDLFRSTFKTGGTAREIWIRLEPSSVKTKKLGPFNSITSSVRKR